MAITRQKKESIVKDVHTKAEKAKVMIFANFHGLNVKDVSELRRKLKKDNADYKVAKKTLVGRVLDGLGFTGTKTDMSGEVAVVFGYEDVVSPAKTLSLFAKKHEGLKILGGVFEKVYVDAASIVRLATIPPREVLLAQLLQVINSPSRGLVVTLNGVMSGFARVLSQIKK